MSKYDQPYQVFQTACYPASFKVGRFEEDDNATHNYFVRQSDAIKEAACRNTSGLLQFPQLTAKSIGLFECDGILRIQRIDDTADDSFTDKHAYHEVVRMARDGHIEATQMLQLDGVGVCDMAKITRTMQQVGAAQPAVQQCDRAIPARTTTDLRTAAMQASSTQAASILLAVADWMDRVEQHEIPLHEHIVQWADRCAAGCRIKAIVQKFLDSAEASL